MHNKQPHKSTKTSPPNFNAYLPSLLSGARLIILPHLIFSFFNGFTLTTYLLFLFAIGTDFFDGRLARRLKETSKLGAILDATIDFIFIIGMFRTFVTAQLYPYWILPLMLLMYLQFVISAFISKKIYDPVGKYYGTLLFGAIGITLLFSSYPIPEILTTGIITASSASLISRLIYLIKN